MILYGELTKLEPLDDGSIRVEGVASTPARDGAGESVSAEAIRKALPAYMAFPAIREMHQPKAAGATLHAEVDEAGETRIVARVVDPIAVKKVKAGVYKGLSIGGKVLARDPADPSRITEVRLDEISLVDRPCNPEATIDLWKAAARAPTNEAVRAEAERMAKAAGRPGRRNDYVAAARQALSNRVPADAAGQAPDEGCSSLPLADGGRDGAGVFAPLSTREAQEAPPPPKSFEKRRANTPISSPSLIEGEGSNDFAKIAAERDDLRRQLADLTREVERLRAEPVPPRTAASTLAKSVGKTEDAGPLAPDAFADALAALPANERAHLIMKAALARPIAL